MKGVGTANHAQTMLGFRKFDDAMEYTMESEENEESCKGKHDVSFGKIVLSVLLQLKQVVVFVLG
jgi:hypothetical protein